MFTPSKQASDGPGSPSIFGFDLLRSGLRKVCYPRWENVLDVGDVDHYSLFCYCTGHRESPTTYVYRRFDYRPHDVCIFLAFRLTYAVILGAESLASPQSPVGAPQGPEQNSPDLDDFASPTQVQHSKIMQYSVWFAVLQF